jgi:thiol:disulfide interchange protein/DsbC/DsbD-like thiol-disulfide interchange protein
MTHNGSPGGLLRRAAWTLAAALLSLAGPAAMPWAGPDAGAARAQPAPAAASAPPTAPPTAPQARPGVQRVDTVEAELVADRAAVRAGGRIELGLRLRHDPHWHTYWRNPGDSGLPTQVAPTGPAGTRFEPVRWPVPMRLWVGPLANYGYEGEVLLPFSAVLPETLEGGTARIEAHVQWLVCKDVCIPGETRVALELPVVAAGAPEPARSKAAALFEATASRIPDTTRPLAARLHRDGATASLAFATPPGGESLARAEFFPHEEGVVSAPAPQPLLRTADGWRIDLALADGATVPATLTGLLVADGRPIALQAQAADGAAPAGTPVSVADRPAGLSRPGGGLLAAITGGGPAASGPSASSPTAAGGVDTGLALALLFGVLGGAILNLMPCVFPVVGLKVLGFAQAGSDPATARGAMRRGALAFAAGVLVSFWLLGGLMLGLRAAGESVGWGFQLQTPGFVAAMALLFVAVGLNFSGVFEIGLSLTRLGGVGGPSAAGSFGAGVLAVLVATPCTAPFMGSALGFTLTQPALHTMAVFTAIGLGMALPYLLLGWFPGWLKRLPRPGGWMLTLRQVLAFPMYATAAWLAWVLVQQSGADALLRLLLAAVLIGLAAWAWGRFGAPAAQRRGIAWGTVAVSVALAAWLLAPLLDDDALAAPQASGAASASSAGGPSRAAGRIGWEPWSEQRVADALADGRPVFVDFTAAWCVTCQANKALVLDRDAVTGEFERLRVVALRADWTHRDAAITAALARHGRNGVPLYLVYRPGSASAVVLPELLTARLVLDALR